MSNDITPDDEQVLDALLEEIHQGAKPPDLTAQILASLSGDADVATRPAPNALPKVERATTKRHKRSQTLGLITALAGLAASIVLVIWLRGDQMIDDEKQTAQDGTPADNIAVVAPVQTEKIASSEPGNTKRDFKAPRGIPLVVSEDPKKDNGNTRPAASDDSNRVAPDITLVSKQHQQDFAAYWKAMGIDPADFSDYTETAARLEERLGLLLSREGLNDVEKLRAELAAPKDAVKVSRSWLRAMTDGGLSKIDEEQRSALVKELAKAISGEKPFDQVMADWVGGQSPNAGTWYAAMSAAGSESMVHRISAITLNADLRCTRCHDALIEGSGRQEQYWSLAALIKQGVRRDGKKMVVAEAKKTKPLFYEVADGRQRAAEPVLPSGWAEGNEGVQSLPAWAKQMRGSRRLASGTVNSLWSLVHNRPLRASVVDAVSAPHHETLDALETRLVDHLIDSDFNIASTLALIITSPVSRLSVPESLRPENALVSTDAELQSARGLVHSFAANLPIAKRMNLSGRISLAMRSTANVRSIPGSNVVNAQARTTDFTDSNTKSKTPVDESAGFPVSANELPVQWLASVKGFDNQVSHLSYLAGNVRVPEEVSKAAVAMKESPGINDELTFQRVWWMLHP